MILYSKREKGFTLIELLVVISVTGLLASIVLASLNTARYKARDASVKNTFDMLRAQINVYEDPNGAPLWVSDVTRNCSAGFFSDGTLQPLLLKALSSSGRPTDTLSVSNCNYSATSNQWSVQMYSSAPNPPGYTAPAVICLEAVGKIKIQQIWSGATTCRP